MAQNGYVLKDVRLGSGEVSSMAVTPLVPVNS